LRPELATSLVDEWREACRIPSVTGRSSPALEAMAAWVAERLARRFDRVELATVEGHAPVVLAELAGTGPGRLLVYSHYDVQPPGDPAEWTVDPFAAELRDGAVYARGTCDDKADVTARLQAVDLWLDERGAGRPPVTLLWVCEGAEEIGSPGLADVLCRHADWLSAGDCLWESFVRRADGRPEIAFGCRGQLTVELRVRHLASDQHAAFSPVLRSAPATLARALAGLTDDEGRVVVAGFHDRVAPPTAEALAWARGIDPPGPGLGIGGGSGNPDGVGHEELARRLSFAPTANISALAAGDTQSGNAVVPAEARARVDFHLVPDQSPAEVAALVRAHLDARGFSDVAMEVVGRVEPVAGDLTSPLAAAAVAAAREVYGEPVVYPQLPGAGPGRILLDALGARIVSPAGTTRLASGIHVADEHGAVADYLDHVRFSVRLLERFAAAQLPR
jgi:acetylornithine deacetylase/succinyl-diaminopimelate desuccinylase-like protein